jgi:hypothetical protein
MSIDNAVKAIDASIKGLRVSRKMLEKVIAQKSFEEEPFDTELRRKAGITRKLASLRTRRAQMVAAGVVVAAPTPAEIRQVIDTIRAVERMAVADAMRRAGTDAILKLAEDSSKLAGKIRV